MARINLKSKKTWKKVGSVFLSVALALGTVIGVTSLITKIEEDTLKTIAPTYHVGALNDIDGEYVESSNSIYSDIFECQGLQITPDFESNVNYRVFYYDLEEKYLDKTATLTDFYKTELPIAKYARVEITPQKDDKVAWYEVSKYATQLKLEVNKEQNFKFDVLKFTNADLKVTTAQNGPISFETFDLGKNPKVMYGFIRNFDLDKNTLKLVFIDKDGNTLDNEVVIAKSDVNNGIFKVDIPNTAYKFRFTSINNDNLIVSLYF